MVEAFGTAVEGMGAVVLRQFVFHSVKGERSVADAVGVAAEGGSEGVAAETAGVQLDAVVVADYIGVVAIFVRNVDADDVTGIVGHLGSDFSISDSVERNRFAVDFGVESTFVNKVAWSRSL